MRLYISSSHAYKLHDDVCDTMGYVPSTAPGEPTSSAVSLPPAVPVAVDGVL